MSFRLLPPAIDDLDELEDWLAENFGPDFVVKTHNALVDDFRRLVKFPPIWSRSNTRMPETRKKRIETQIKASFCVLAAELQNPAISRIVPRGTIRLMSLLTAGDRR